MSDRHVPVSSGMTMQGLGQLIKLYGGAAASTEEEYQHLKQEYENADAENSGVLESIKAGMMAAQDRLHKILIGAKAAIDQAGSHLVSQFSSGDSMDSFKNKLQQNKQAYNANSNTSSVFLKSSDPSFLKSSNPSERSSESDDEKSRRSSYDDSDDDDNKHSDSDSSDY